MIKTEKDEWAVAVGIRVDAAARGMGLAAKEAARALGVNHGTYAGYVSGHRTFPCELLPRAAEVFGRSLHYFFGLPDPRGLTPEEQTAASLASQLDPVALSTWLDVGQKLAMASRGLRGPAKSPGDHNKP